MERQRRLVVFAAAAGFWLLLAGFFVFAASSTRRVAAEVPAADGIVVLTGEGRRIDAGFALFRQGVGTRLLISGVNQRTRRDEVLRRRIASDAADACCVDLGYDAQSTVGNAFEAKTWAEHHGFRRLIVVTSSYHMPRSLNELALAMPDVELIAYPVAPRHLGNGPWWLRSEVTRVLVAEYFKLLPSYARWAAHRLLVRPIEDIAVGRPELERQRAAAL